MKKRITAALLAVLLGISTAGCGGSGGNGSQQAEQNTETEESAQKDDFWTEETADGQKEAGASGSAEKEQGTAAEEPASEEAEQPFALGEYSGSTYRQPYFGFQADLDGFTLTEASDRAKMSGIDEASADTAAILDALDRGGFFVDLQASHNGSAPIILVEIMRQESTTMGDSENAMASTVAQSFAATMEQSGASDVTISTAAATFLGEEREAAAVTCRVSGVDVYEKLLVVKKGRYAAVLMVSTFYEDETDKYLGYFRAL